MNLKKLKHFLKLQLLHFPIAIILFGIVLQFNSGQACAQGTQPIVITGTVTDSESGEPLAGVNIVILDTYIGAATDLSGKYSITVPNEKASLCFSFIGYHMQTIPIGSQRQINVALVSDVAELEEVVVVGYGMQKKESVVGAVSQVSGDVVVNNIQGGDFATGLQGALPGLTMIINTGRPGGLDLSAVPSPTSGASDDYAYMHIRAQNTWSDASPLVLVDGVERSLNNVNPHEVEKISILKDASATAVFGVKGANGVILITTLRGREGKPRLSFDVSTTAKTMARFPMRENSYITHKYKNYAILNEVPSQPAAWALMTPTRWMEYYRDHTYPEYLADVNWPKESLKDVAFDRNVNLSITGGTKFVKYYGAVSHLYEGDIFRYIDIGRDWTPSHENSRYNFRSNLDFDFTPSTRFSMNLAGHFINQARPTPAGSSGAGSYRTLWTSPPDLYPVMYSDGTFAENTAFQSKFINGLAAWSTGGVAYTKQTNLTTDFMLNQNLDFITKGFSARAKLSADNSVITAGPNISSTGRATKYILPQIVDYIKPGMTEAEIRALEDEFTIWEQTGASATNQFDWTKPPDSYGTESSTDARTYRNLYYELSLNYARDFGKHAITGMGLFSRQQQATGSIFPGFREDWVGRTTYSFDRRYLLELNASYNGSEKFSRKYRFGFFPSYAIGWQISNESFFEPLRHIISNLKVRYSDGKIGSDAGIDRWMYVSSWLVNAWTTSASSDNVSRFGAPYLQNSLAFRYEGTVPNPDIHWETAVKKNLGFELGFFNNAIRMNYDIFRERRSNIYVLGNERYIPDMVGATPTAANIGIVNSWGWEYELHASKTTARGLNIWFSYIWTFAKDKIIERGDPQLKPEYQKQAGRQIGQPTGQQNQGPHAILSTWNDIYNTTALSTNTFRLPGDMAVVDFNCDGIIDSNDAVPMGFTERPQYTYTPVIGMSYKNWSANIQFYGVYNVEGTLATYLGGGLFPDQYNVIFPKHIQQHWSPEFGVTDEAVRGAVRFSTSGTTGRFPQTRAYTKLNHAEIGYTISNQITKKIGVSNLRLLLSGDNLVLWSKMPEDADAAVTYRGSIRSTYPRTIRYNLKLSFNF